MEQPPLENNHDILTEVFKKLSTKSDQDSFRQVSKKFYQAGNIYRTKLCYPSPHQQLEEILRFTPNLRKFSSSKPMSNNQIKLLSYCSCQLLSLILCTSEEEVHSEADFDNNALINLGNSCMNLEELNLLGRLNIGHVGVSAMVTACKNLKFLALSHCVRDETLKIIGERSLLRTLVLKSCVHVSDDGLRYLAHGALKTSLEKLDISECEGIITNVGITYLGNNIAGLGILKLRYSNIYEKAVIAITAIPNLRCLDLCGVTSVTDKSVAEIGKFCRKLEYLTLSGCNSLTREGIKGLSHLPDLIDVELSGCYNITLDDIERLLAKTCPSFCHVTLTPKGKDDLETNGIYTGNFNFVNVYWRSWEEGAKYVDKCKF